MPFQVRLTISPSATPTESLSLSALVTCLLRVMSEKTERRMTFVLLMTNLQLTSECPLQSGASST